MVRGRLALVVPWIMILAACDSCEKSGKADAGVAPELPALTKREVMREMGKHMKEFYACYHPHVKERSESYDRFDIALQVRKDGRVEKVTIESATLRKKEVLGCLVKTVQGLMFPRSSGHEEPIRIPLMLKSKEAM